MARPLGIGILGCGDIARTYAASVAASPALSLVAAADRHADRAQDLTLAYGGSPGTSVDEVLANSEVELVVNLTRHYSHAEVNSRSLIAGKHVYSEKPLAMTGAEAWNLVKLARARKVRLGCAPATYLGEAQQTAWAVVRSGLLGAVRVVYADVNWGQIERWHPRPQDFYAAGALFDVGVYPLTLLTSFFGPARRVCATARTLRPQRIATDGTTFTIGAPDFVIGAIELAAGPLIRLTCGFYVDASSRQRGIEIHGDDGSLLMDRWYEFGAGVHVARRGGPVIQVPPVTPPPAVPVDYGRPLADMAEAIGSGRPHRAAGEQAAHVVDVIEALLASARAERPVGVSSTFSPPAPGAPGLSLPSDQAFRGQLDELLDRAPERTQA